MLSKMFKKAISHDNFATGPDDWSEIAPKSSCQYLFDAEEAQQFYLRGYCQHHYQMLH